MTDEGYIRFEAAWTKARPLPWAALEELDDWRDRMYAAGLIGAYPGGIGFGNISRRADAAGRFIITGSATGNFAELSAAHYCLVTHVDTDANRLTCQGPIIASSESMSHAVIYLECPEVNGVIHVHHLALWQHLLHRVPTTDARATYGTPEMAHAITGLLRHSALKKEKILVMEGHREGILAFGNDLREAGEHLLGLLAGLEVSR